MALSALVRLGLLAALAAAGVACTVETTTTEVGGGSGGGGYAGGSTPGSPCLGCDAGPPDGEVSPGSPTPSAEPMLGMVDPNVKMSASPGEGVGVFTEYANGGHWTIWWTCDTNITSQTCPFDVKVSSAKSEITNAAAMGFSSSDSLVTPANPAAGTAGEIEAKTTTTTGVSSIMFDTTPGAKITLTATVGGLYNGKFLFWVQDGKVNGGYKGTVTDPLMLVGASP